MARGRGETLVMSRSSSRIQRAIALVGTAGLLLVTSLSMIAVLFIFFFIARDALPFFQLRGFSEFFTSTRWYPSGHPAEFGALAIIVGSGLVTLGAAVVAIPLGVAAAVCLSDILPFSARQVVKPMIEILAAIPSVAYGFFALVVLAPAMQASGGRMLSVAVWLVGVPVAGLLVFVLGDVLTSRTPEGRRRLARAALTLVLAPIALAGLALLARRVSGISITTGTNALNVSVILGIMALPTVVSVSEDALQAVGRDLREGSYALGATRAETIVRTIIPAAGSGIMAAAILGIMRAVGETMVVWMASGNAAQIPKPWFNLLEPVRTLTATIAGDMGEADQVTGSERFHVLFAMALFLLVFSLAANWASELILKRSKRRLGR